MTALQAPVCIGTADRGVSVVLVAHNDRATIGGAVREIGETLARAGHQVEVVVVDDASTDGSADVAREAGAVVVMLPVRLGYAAAVRTGVEVARYETIALFDPESGYQAADLARLLTRASDHAMVVGSRPPSAERSAPLSRRIARGILRRTAQALAARPIPDLNSGVRVFQRRAFRRFAPLARGFALTTVLTLGMLTEGLAVAWVPVGWSQPPKPPPPRPFTDLLEVVHLVVRMTLLFNPLRILAPPGYLLLAGGAALAGVDIWRAGDAGGLAVLLVVAGMVVLATGFLADLMGTIGRLRE